MPNFIYHMPACQFYSGVAYPPQWRNVPKIPQPPDHKLPFLFLRFLFLFSISLKFAVLSQIFFLFDGAGEL